MEAKILRQFLFLEEGRPHLWYLLSDSSILNFFSQHRRREFHCCYRCRRLLDDLLLRTDLRSSCCLCWAQVSIMFLQCADENRFYGKSQPLSNLSTENLRYLNSRQALADLANFIVSLKVNLFNIVDHIRFLVSSHRDPLPRPAVTDVNLTCGLPEFGPAGSTLN